MPDLSIIIVNWNVADLLHACLESVLAETQLSLEVIVVDSASSDHSVAMVQAEFPQVTLMAGGENLGYAKGNNWGADAATGRYLLLLNPDTVVKPNALAAMVAYLDVHPEVGVVGPQLLWPDGTVQSSRRRLPTRATLFWESTLLGQWFPDNSHIRRYHCADLLADHTLSVDWLVGAALCIRRETWQQVGLLDHSFFMYFEETDWCHRCGLAGWSLVYLPTAQIVHYEGQSSGQVVAARTVRFQRSKVRYAEKYFGPGWARAIYLFLWLTFAYQLAEESAKWLIGHRRDMRWQRMTVYRQLLRDFGW